MQRITTPKGETLVVLPLSDYEKLVDGVDIAAAERVKTDIAAGRDELVPADFADRILAGENRVRVWRSYRGTTAIDLANRTGLSQSYISEIETGKKEGSISAMKKIAEALNVDLDDIA